MESIFITNDSEFFIPYRAELCVEQGVTEVIEWIKTPAKLFDYRIEKYNV